MSKKKRRLKVTVGDEVGIAELFEDAAPKTSKAIWNALPIDGRLNHANFSGEEITFPSYGLMWEKENQLHDTQPGDLGFFVQGPAICIYYGALRVLTPGNVFGRIVENVAGVQRVARQCWRESGVLVRLEKLD